MPEDRVLLVGVTSEPHACIARDGDALRSLFTLRFCVPMLTRLDRQVTKGAQMLRQMVSGMAATDQVHERLRMDAWPRNCKWAIAVASNC